MRQDPLPTEAFTWLVFLGELKMSAKYKDLKRKKTKKYYCSNVAKKRRTENLEPGIKGFLITCNNRKEHTVVSEAYRLLNEYADVMYGPENVDDQEQKPDDDDDDQEEESIEDALKKEVEDMKNSKFKERRFKAVKTKVKNVLFIKTTIEDPSKLVHTIFSDIEKTKLKKTRHCMKLIPIAKTCYASQEAIKTKTEEVFREFFQHGRDEATYSIVFKARCNSTLKRDIIVPEVAKIIENLNEEWTVDYHTPDYVVTLDILANVCAIGILRDFNRFRKYNLQSIAEDKKDDANEENKKKIEDSGEKCNSSETNCPSSAVDNANVENKEIKHENLEIKAENALQDNDKATIGIKTES